MAFSASFNAFIPSVPILPELSTDTMTLGAGSLVAEPAGAVEKLKAAWAAMGMPSALMAKLSRVRVNAGGFFMMDS